MTRKEYLEKIDAALEQTFECLKEDLGRANTINSCDSLAPALFNGLAVLTDLRGSVVAETKGSGYTKYFFNE